MAVATALVAIEPTTIRIFERMANRKDSQHFDADGVLHALISSAYRAGAGAIACLMSHPDQPHRKAVSSLYQSDLDRMSSDTSRNLSMLVEALIEAGIPVVSEPGASVADLVAGVPPNGSFITRASDPIVFQTMLSKRRVTPLFNRDRQRRPLWTSLPPTRLPEYFALTGRSDTYPIVPTCEPEMALSLLRSYNSFDQILMACKETEAFRGRCQELRAAHTLLTARATNPGWLPEAVSL